MQRTPTWAPFLDRGGEPTQSNAMLQQHGPHANKHFRDAARQGKFPVCKEMVERKIVNAREALTEPSSLDWEEEILPTMKVQLQTLVKPGAKSAVG